MKKVPGIEAISDSQSWEIDATVVIKTHTPNICTLHTLVTGPEIIGIKFADDAEVEPEVGKGMAEVRRAKISNI